MTLFVAWAVFPLVFAALAFGCGRLLERIARVRLPGALLLPAGFAVVLVTASLTTIAAGTAQFTTPLVVALAVAGLGQALRFRPDHWAVAAACAVFACYAAPVVLSGSATFAGYITLDDTATWFAFADNALVHGHSLAGLAPSSYSAVLHDNLPSGYPLGAMLPLGVAHQLVRIDVAWLFQPYLAFLAALLALSLYALVLPLLRRNGSAALAAFVGAQPAVLYGYAFWSGVKELTVAYLLALVAALAAYALAEARGPSALVPLAVAGAAILDSLSLLGLVWLFGLLGAVGLVVTRGRHRSAFPLLVALVCGAVLALPALVYAGRFLHGAYGGDSGHGALGNLFHPLSVLQLGGVWPTGDFRGRPTEIVLTKLMLVVLVAAVVFALVEACRRRIFGLPLYLLGALAGWASAAGLDSLGHGSPWLDGKAIASASPAFLVAGICGAALLFERRPRLGGVGVGGVAVAAVLVFGVLWSNALAYGDVWLAPRDQLSELETIGARFAGQGPALMTEYQPYGVRHFLRRLDAEGASERRTRLVPLRSGGSLEKEQYADLDAFDLAGLLVYRTLVLRTSPLSSRPPSVYVPVWHGRWYEVWQRPLQPATILEHLPLGSAEDPTGLPRCADVRRLAAVAAGHGGTVVAAVRPEPLVVGLVDLARPAAWLPGAQPGTVLPAGAGTLDGTAVLPRSGSVAFALGGSFRDEMQLRVDGRLVGRARDQLEETAQLTPLGSTLLAAGPHEFELRYDGAGWRPGSRGSPFLVGPLVIGAPATRSTLLRVAPARAASLCSRRLDWIEAVAR